ncbi:unnamed protein product [Pylaiella littoralis]
MKYFEQSPVAISFLIPLQSGKKGKGRTSKDGHRRVGETSTNCHEKNKEKKYQTRWSVVRNIDIPSLSKHPLSKAKKARHAQKYMLKIQTTQ